MLMASIVMCHVMLMASIVMYHVMLMASIVTYHVMLMDSIVMYHVMLISFGFNRMLIFQHEKACCYFEARTLTLWMPDVHPNCYIESSINQSLNSYIMSLSSAALRQQNLSTAQFNVY